MEMQFASDCLFIGYDVPQIGSVLIKRLRLILEATSGSPKN